MWFLGVRVPHRRCLVSRFLFALVLLGALPSCGGKVVHRADGTAGTDNMGMAGADGMGVAGADGMGMAGSGGDDSQSAPLCTKVTTPPTITFERTCAGYTPSLGPTEVEFVELTQSTVAGETVFQHRFRATEACGFDAIVSMPEVRFLGDSAPYSMNTWWLSDASGTTSLVAIALRRAFDSPVLLGVATATWLDSLNSLVAPLAVELSDDGCLGSSNPDFRKPFITRNDAPLQCTDESNWRGLRLCQDDLSSFRVLNYLGVPGLNTHPAVFGDAELLQAGED